MANWIRSFALLCVVTVAPLPFDAQIPPNTQELGTLENGVYHNALTGIEVTVAPIWIVASQTWSSTDAAAQVIKLKDSASNAVATVWVKRRDTDPANLEALMSGRLDAKTAQRNNFEGYKFRSDSVRHTTINGRPALSAVADYVSVGQKMVEYLTWIDGEKSRLVFVGHVPVPDLPNFQALLDPVIQSAVVP